MALTQKQRVSIYTGLAPLVGESEAEALLAQFPSDDLDTPATKDFVRAEIGDLRTELRTEVGGLRTELRTEFGELRAEMMNRLRSQTIWSSGVILAAAGLIRFA